MTPPTAPPATGRPAPGRLSLTGYAAWQLVLGFPALLLLLASLLGAALLAVWVGAVLLVVAVPATRALAQEHRRMAAHVLGRDETRPYRPIDRAHPWSAVAVVAGDPMTYRDVAWLLWACTFGFVVALVCVLELLAVLTLPLWWWTVRTQMTARSQIDVWFLVARRTEDLEQRVQELTETRADLVDHSAAELRRLERDLHDGPQARLVALSMSLGLADQVLASDPAAARRLVDDARVTAQAAIDDLRSVVRGIHPPVLADRGLAGAVRALALDMAIPVEVESTLVVRPPPPVESALYFAVAECLANMGKHSGAVEGRITLGVSTTGIRVGVGDHGCGGADPDAGTGLAGVQRRLAAFDGTMAVSSPIGGPTEVTLEVPCDSSSLKTTPCSAPG